MPWKTMDRQQQRVEFVVAASRKETSFLELCEEFGISRPTGYLWVERYRERGLGGIAEGSRRPQHSPQRTGGEPERQVVELRRRYPDWGARKLQWLLAQQGVGLAVSTVHRILLRHELVRVADRHQHAVRRFTRERPNQLWQMDYKSPLGWGTHVGPLSVLDDHSRYLLVLAATGSTRAQAVREQLEEAFCRCGVPEAMLMDHGTPWWNTQSAGGITWLAIWLMKQGIRLYWSGFRHPQTQGKVERFHGCLERAMGLRGLPGEGRQAWLDAFRQEHNQMRPHEALGMKTPASVWRRSAKNYDAHPPRWEYPAGAEVKHLGQKGQVRIEGKIHALMALAGEWVQLVRIEDRMLVYYCNTVVREVELGSHRAARAARWLPS
jgi:transposase InsO family protein